MLHPWETETSIKTDCEVYGEGGGGENARERTCGIVMPEKILIHPLQHPWALYSKKRVDDKLLYFLYFNRSTYDTWPWRTMVKYFLGAKCRTIFRFLQLAVQLCISYPKLSNIMSYSSFFFLGTSVPLCFRYSLLALQKKKKTFYKWNINLLNILITFFLLSGLFVKLYCSISGKLVRQPLKIIGVVS